MRSHGRIAEWASGSAVQPPGSREDTKGKPALLRIAHGQSIRAGGAAAADDLHSGQPVDQEPVKIGSHTRIIRERTGTGNDETKHSKHLQNERRRENPRGAGRHPPCLLVCTGALGLSRAALPLVLTLDWNGVSVLPHQATAQETSGRARKKR